MKDFTKGIAPENIYYVGKHRAHKSITKLFLELKDDTREKVIFLDEGTYDIFREYRDVNMPTPPDDVKAHIYFEYNAFLPVNTRLIGIGDVLLKFSPAPEEITYGESRTWAPLNIEGACHIENINIYCKNGRYCIHDDSHNRYQDTRHYYKNVRCVYEFGDTNQAGQRLGFNNTIGNGMAQGTEFLFEDCTFTFRGENRPAFYTHESGRENPQHVPTLTFRNCDFIAPAGNDRTIKLQNLAPADVRVVTRFENCHIIGGIYLELYKDRCPQHFDVTFVNSGNPPQLIDKPEENRYPIKVE